MQTNNPEPKKLVWPKELDTFLEAASVLYDFEYRHTDSDLALMLLEDLGYPKEDLERLESKTIESSLAFQLHALHAWNNCRGKIISMVIVQQTKLIHRMVKGE